jgi:hypothetical protein
MKLTTQRLKKLIREEIKKIEEGIDYTNKYTPDGAAIYYEDEKADGLDDSDIKKGEEAIKKARSRDSDQSVPFGSKLYYELKDYYVRKGYKFIKGKGSTDLVKPVGHDNFVKFVFRYVKQKRGNNV